MKLDNSSHIEESQRDLFIPALIVFSVIYSAQTCFVGLFLIDWRYFSSAVFFLGFEMIFIGIAYDITESIFALFSQPRKTPRLDLLEEYPPVALLMTVCDDSRPSRWPALAQEYPCCDIFILDDSKDLKEQSLVDQSGYTVIRRPEKQAFKAGNLNYWLGHYGNNYKYLVILDSDSLITPDFVRSMVSFAEHPANQKIAVFQSYIFPTEAETIFSRTLGNIAKLRFYIYDRFANRTGWVLSWGHNQLVRVDGLRQAGGFCESISAEDTSLSLALSQLGYTIRVVNIISYDTDPPNIFLFMRRIVRWAGQTAEVFSLPWNGSSFRLKLLLCQHLYTYTIHNIYIGLLLYTAWGFDSRGISAMKLFEFIGSNMQVLWLWSLVLAEMTLLWLVQLSLRAYLGRRAKISMINFFEHLLLSTALHSFTGLAIDISVYRGLTNKKIDFRPTNARETSAKKFLLDFTKGALFWLATSTFILLGMSLRNNLLFFSLNGLWIFFWTIAPLTLLVFHRDQFGRG